MNMHIPFVLAYNKNSFLNNNILKAEFWQKHISGNVNVLFLLKDIYQNMVLKLLYSFKQRGGNTVYTVNPALLTSSFVWQMQLSLLHINFSKLSKENISVKGNVNF